MAAADWKPSPKVAGGGVAGAAATVVLWLVDELTPLSPPALVAAAISLLVTAGVAYFIPAHRGGEAPLTENERQAVLRAYDEGVEALRTGGPFPAPPQRPGVPLTDFEALRGEVERRKDQQGG